MKKDKQYYFNLYKNADFIEGKTTMQKAGIKSDISKNYAINFNGRILKDDFKVFKQKEDEQKRLAEKRADVAIRKEIKKINLPKLKITIPDCSQINVKQRNWEISIIPNQFKDPYNLEYDGKIIQLFTSKKLNVGDKSGSGGQINFNKLQRVVSPIYPNLYVDETGKSSYDVDLNKTVVTFF